jgi:adenylylsulfate kinase
VRAVTIWLTGLSGSGKSTTGSALKKYFSGLHEPFSLLDGDALRAGLNRDLGFSKEDRHENLRRIAEVAKLFNDAGVSVAVAAISPYQHDRRLARQIVGSDRFLEVYMNTPLEVCEHRDPKGLYTRARAGELPDFTGVSAPYEAPSEPDLCIDGSQTSVEDGVTAIVDVLASRGWLPSRRVPCAAAS